jgi:epoxyqueuosine reductase
MVLSEIKSKYANYRFKKIRDLEISINNENNVIKASYSSPERFNVNKKVQFKNLRTLFSIGKNVEDNVKSLKNNPANPKTVVSKNFVQKFEKHARSMGIESVGYTKVHPDLIFKDRAILFENAIVFTKEIDQFAVNNDFPEKQTNDLMLYDEFGKKTNELVDYLRDNGFSAQASHPSVGFVTYPSLAQSAGIGWKGKSNLLITPELGPRQKISAIFTSIENLPVNEHNEHSWISYYCNNCGKCIKKCPRNAIVEKSDNINGSEFIPELCKGCTDICTICMKECPFNKMEYSDIKRRFEKVSMSNIEY